MLSPHFLRLYHHITLALGCYLLQHRIAVLLLPTALILHNCYLFPCPIHGLGISAAMAYCVIVPCDLQ